MSRGASSRVTGERATSSTGGFNPTWQRHVAAYRAVGGLIDRGPVLDLGCGLGHSYRLLGDHQTFGLDLGFDALRGQGRPVMQADMRSIPLRADAAASVVSVQSLEHVPDPQRVLADVARVLTADGVAVFVTPNRLTFGKPDEIIDPWHFVEFDATELAELCRSAFDEVQVLGLFGSPTYNEIWDQEHVRLDRLLSIDRLRLRRLLTRRMKQWGYDVVLNRYRAGREHPASAQITVDDFHVGTEDVETSLDLIAVCRQPRRRATP